MGPLSCLSVMLVYCGETVGWTKMPYGTMGTQFPHGKGHSSPPPPLFGPCLLWPNGWMDQDTTWYGGRPRPRQHCVRWGPCSPRESGKGHSSPQNFLSTLLWHAAHLSNCWARSSCNGELWPVTLNSKTDLAVSKWMNQHDKYLGQRSFDWMS